MARASPRLDAGAVFLERYINLFRDVFIGTSSLIRIDKKGEKPKRPIPRSRGHYDVEERFTQKFDLVTVKESNWTLKFLRPKSYDFVATNRVQISPSE